MLKYNNKNKNKQNTVNKYTVQTKSRPHECLNKRKVADFRPVSAGQDGRHYGGCVASLYVDRQVLNRNDVDRGSPVASRTSGLSFKLVLSLSAP